MTKEQEQGQEKKHQIYAPAYTAFKTLKGFVHGINPSAIPRQLDKSMMRSISGGAQRKLWSGMIFLRLITQEGIVTDHLKKLVMIKEDVPAWKTLLGQLINEAYRPILTGLDVTTATAKQLEDRFRAANVDGSTLKDAIRFYIHACKEAGVPVSPYVAARQPRSQNSGAKSGAVAKPRAPKPSVNREQLSDGDLTLPIPKPGQPNRTMTVPADIDEADCEMINTILLAIAKRRNESESGG